MIFYLPDFEKFSHTANFLKSATRSHTREKDVARICREMSDVIVRSRLSRRDECVSFISRERAVPAKSWHARRDQREWKKMTWLHSWSFRSERFYPEGNSLRVRHSINMPTNQPTNAVVARPTVTRESSSLEKFILRKLVKKENIARTSQNVHKW